MVVGWQFGVEVKLPGASRHQVKVLIVDIDRARWRNRPRTAAFRGGNRSRSPGPGRSRRGFGVAATIAMSGIDARTPSRNRAVGGGEHEGGLDAVFPFSGDVKSARARCRRRHPVGAAMRELVEPGGTPTTSERVVADEADVLYSVLVPVPSFANHHSPVELAASPQEVDQGSDPAPAPE